MKSVKISTLALAVAAAFLAQGALAADAKKPAAKDECAETASMPKPASSKARADVKAEAKGAATECEASASPAAKSTKSRAEVKEETKKAVKAGEIPQGEAMVAPKK